jgi:tetratricopeptide (TPR) repeat protein
MLLRTASLILILFISSVASVRGQAGPAAPVETQQALVAHLTAQQKQQFDDAGKAFNAAHFADALTGYKRLLEDLPGDAVISKFAGEAALDVGDTTYALETLKPIAQSNPNDWQAVALLTRAYAESGDKASRDAGIAQMIALHKRGITPAKTRQFIVERTKVGEHVVLIFVSLEPWGHYHVYNYAQIFDEGGRLALRAAVQSDDVDQAAFAKQHPTEAAAGLRGFSLDGYQDSGKNSDGHPTETHYTFKFFAGQPAYDTVRSEFLSIASGQTKPISSRVNALSQ